MERQRECRNPVRERQLCSGDFGFVTWRSSSYMYIMYAFGNLDTLYVYIDTYVMDTRSMYHKYEIEDIPIVSNFEKNTFNPPPLGPRGKSIGQNTPAIL